MTLFSTTVSVEDREFHGHDLEPQLTREAKAVLLPELAIVYPRPDDLLHQVLGIRTLDRLGIFCSSVRHEAPRLVSQYASEKKNY